MKLTLAYVLVRKSSLEPSSCFPVGASISLCMLPVRDIPRPRSICAWVVVPARSAVIMNICFFFMLFHQFSYFLNQFFFGPIGISVVFVHNVSFSVYNQHVRYHLYA